MKFVKPPKIWIAWTAGVVLAIVLSLIFAGCATTEAYRGPVGKEALVTLDVKRHIVTPGPREATRMESIKTLKVTNPSMDGMTVTVECDSNPLSNPMSAGPTYMTMDIPARTTQSLLLLPEDGSCLVKQWP